MLQSPRNLSFTPSDAPHHRDCIVVGGGPVGVRVAQELVRHGRAVSVMSAGVLPP